MKKTRLLFVAICVAAISAATASPLHAAVMQNYCAQPPYITTDVAPNIMILMDNSKDMYNSAYCNDTTNNSPQDCTDAYAPNATKDNYIGYFIPQSCYAYSGQKFVEYAKTPAGPISCTAGTPNCYTSYTYADSCPSDAPFRGNLLNWATMSKYDVLQKVLIGGNSTSKQSNANTLLSIGAAWQKTYNGCVFNVSNANLQLTETSAGSCALLDSPGPVGFAYLNGQKTVRTAKARIGNWMSSGLNGLAGIASSALDELNPVSTAWAATGVGIQAGSVNGTMGNTFSITFECTGTGSDCPNGTYAWTISGAPSWLNTTTYTSSGSKTDYRLTLTGDPTSVGDFGPISVSFSVSGKSASASYTITISGGTLAIISGSLPNGVIGASYTTTVTGKGGTTCASPTTDAYGNYIWQYQWSATGLPPGLSIDANTGVISGTPTSATNSPYGVDITMTDCSPTPGSVTKTLYLTVTVPTLMIETQSLPNGSVSSPYSTQLTGIGGAGYTWSITYGYLPFGLFLDPSTGIISGNTCPFTSTGALQNTPGYETGSGPGIRTRSYDLVTPVNILKTDPFSVVQGHSYLVSTCPADGGMFTGDPFLQLAGEYEYYQDDSCSLGPRINFYASSDGTEEVRQSTYGANVVPDTTWSYNIKDLTDNIQCQGTFDFTISLASAGTTTTKNFSITIGPGGLSIDSTSLMPAVKNTPYSFTVIGSGGTGPYTWTATGLPSSLSLSSGGTSTAVISGTPGANEVGTYPVTITLTDSTNTTVTRILNLNVLQSLVPRTQNYNVRVDIIEEPFTDTNGNDICDPTIEDCLTSDWNGNGKWDGKQGVFQKYWDVNNPKARWGLTDFTNQGVQIEACVPASPASSFYTAMQNATPTSSAQLANGLYGDMNYYIFSTAGLPQPPFDPSPNSFRGCTNSDPIDNTSCRKNFVLIISSGADLTGQHFTVNPDLSSFPTATSFAAPGVTTGGQCSIVRAANESQPLVLDACYGFLNDMRNDRTRKQQIFTYVVNTMGTAANGQILEDAATAGGGNYYDASSTANLEEQLDLAFKDMLARATSGTAASVLASGEGSGANLVQAVFYPKRKYGTTSIDWIGRLTNLWYYVDPLFAFSSIREDDGDRVLTLLTEPTGTHRDYIVNLSFDGEQTLATRATDSNGDGAPDGIPTPPTPSVVSMEDIGNLWEAGTLLWERDPATRKIYTSTTGNSLMNFSADNATATTLAPYLNVGSVPEAQDIINWVRGTDVAGLRERSVKIDLNNDGDTLDTVGGYSEATPRVWKLGDVLNSTPKISSWIALNGYHKIDQDSTYGPIGQDPSLTDPPDPNHYITTGGTTTAYRDRGMVYAGANDGMLHAFKLGTLELKWSGQNSQYEKARLIGSGLGQEEWAFIPKNVLPYLKYLADPAYCHVYSVDLTPYIFDASIGGNPDDTRTVDSWRTILIGGMRYGGASAKYDDTCSTDHPDSVCAPKTGLGYSAYFALDITDENNPTLLWERSGADTGWGDSGGTWGLGFTTGGPAVVRIDGKNGGGDPDRTRNGNWFVVFASGPTGPISSDGQFMGSSDQPLTVYVVDLRTGDVKAVFHHGTAAFGGSMYNSTMDTDNPPDYQDDVIYIPYVEKAADNTWTDGGVLRLSTKEDPDPTHWNLSTVIDGIGPVTSAVAKLKNNTTNTLWLYFGTGRYYFEQNGTPDDSQGQRQIFGVKDPCLLPNGTYDGSCTASVDFSCAAPCGDATANPWCTTPATCGDLVNVTDVNNAPTNPNDPDFKGCYINLDPDETPDTRFRAERIITDPLATGTGVVFFTSYKPYSDECDLGGESAIWAMKYNTCGSAGTLLQGKALIQVSTGSIEQINLGQAFSNAGGRKTAQIQGVPPTAQGLSILAPPKPVKRVLHIRER